MQLGIQAHAAQLVACVHRLHARGWAPGTGGNFSVVVDASAPRLLMTPSGVDKGRVTAAELVTVDGAGQVVAGAGQASAETALHLEVVRRCGAGAVLHVHSVWNTLLSQHFAGAGVVAIAGYEMLKGLAGVTTHTHTEVVPVLGNDQNIGALATAAGGALAARPASHGFLVAGHGLTTWGVDLAEAERHVEIFEFLFEVVGRQVFAR